MSKRKQKENRNVILKHIKNNLKEYISVIIVFLIGIVLGVILLNNSNDIQKQELNSYVNDFVTQLNSGISIDKFQLLKNVLLNNLIIVIGLWFIGSTVIGIPIVYAIVAYKGFCLSYSISAILAVLGGSKGICFVLASMLPQNIIYIPCILALAVSGIKLYKSIMKDRRIDNIKLEIFRHILFSLFIGILFIIGSLVETYISSNIIMNISQYM